MISNILKYFISYYILYNSKHHNININYFFFTIPGIVKD